MKVIQGIGAASGIAVGRVTLIQRRFSGVYRQVREPLQEQALFDVAHILAKDELLLLKEKAMSEDKDIFLFQSAILDDTGFLAEVSSYIAAGAGAAVAVERASSIFEKQMRNIDDEYFNERAVDVHDACLRIVNILDDKPRERLLIKRPSIIIAEEIQPSDIVSLERGMMLGFITVKGSKQGHASIIARTMNIPAVVRTPLDMSKITDGMIVAVDGNTGEVFLDPSESVKARFVHKIRKAKRLAIQLKSNINDPCISKNNIKINLYANCTTPAEIKDALIEGATGIGLVRSEFLYMGAKLPSYAAQKEFYCACVQAANGLPLTIRTMDIGADKEIRGLSMSSEPNPALGLRGIRLSLARPELFKEQLRALLVAGLMGPLRVMFPMISTVQDFSEAMEVVEEVKYELKIDGAQYAKDIKWGAMIETPSAALCADVLAKKADFFSIGTNDLTQYTHAADRENALVDSYYIPSSQAVLKLIDMTVKAARRENIPVSICGESAAVPQTALQYLEYSVDTLSMSAGAIASVKEHINSSVINLK